MKTQGHALLLIVCTVVTIPCMQNFLARVENCATNRPTLCTARMPGNGNIFQVRS